MEGLPGCGRRSETDTADLFKGVWVGGDAPSGGFFFQSGHSQSRAAKLLLWISSKKNCQWPKHLSTCWTTVYLADQGLSYVNCYSDPLEAKQEVMLNEMKTGLWQWRNTLLYGWVQFFTVLLGKCVSGFALSPRISRAVPAVMVNHNVRYSGDVFFPSWMDGIQINDSNLSELCAEGENIFIFFLLNNKNASPAISITTIRSPETYFTRNSYILCRRKWDGTKST